MVEFIKYTTSNNGNVTTVKETSTKAKVSPSSFSLITPFGTVIRDYVKRKLFKATKEEVSHLLKSTSNLNIAAKFQSNKSPSKGKIGSKNIQNITPKVIQDEEASSLGSLEKMEQIIDHQHDNGQSLKQCYINKLDALADENCTAVMTVEPSTQIMGPKVEKIKQTIDGVEIFSKERSNEEVTMTNVTSSSNSLSADKDQRKSVKWAERLITFKTQSEEFKEEARKKEAPIKWTKRFRKAAVRTCRYLGYGAQMIAPITPYSDIPMSITLDNYSSIYHLYYY